jgi:uncharacterized protein (TIGR00251 family)
VNGPWHRNSGGDILLRIHAQPGARKTQLAGVHGTALKLRLAAPPVEGAANEVLIRFLADLFSVPRRQVMIESGAGARQKTVRIQGVSKLPAVLAAHDG